MNTLEIPATEGRAFEVMAERQFRIVTPHGGQAADFFAFNVVNTGEWLSPNHTWVWTRSIKPRQGDVLLSRYRRPLLEFMIDGAEGVHDMTIAACDQHRYEQLGFQGPHASCADNLKVSMQRLGHEINVVPQPINFFTNTAVEADSSLVSPPNPVKSGAFVQLKALVALICVVSACPFDLDLPDWQINAPSGPTGLVVEFV